LALQSLPLDWLLQYIEHYAEPLLALNDDWDYTRLCDVYKPLDDDLLRRFVARGVSNSNADIQDRPMPFKSA
jgi:hypothetical protein